MDIKNNVYYKKILKDPWPYAVGAVLLGLLNIVMFASSGEPWGIASAFAAWAARIYQYLGGQPETWLYFQQEGKEAALNGPLTDSIQSLTNIGIVFGALLATLLASQFRIKKIKSWRQVCLFFLLRDYR